MKPEFFPDKASADELKIARCQHIVKISDFEIKITVSSDNLIDLPQDHDLVDPSVIKRDFLAWASDIRDGKSAFNPINGYSYFNDRSIGYIGKDYFHSSLAGFLNIILPMDTEDARLFRACLIEHCRNLGLSTIDAPEGTIDPESVADDFYLERAVCQITYIGACYESVVKSKELNDLQKRDITDLYSTHVSSILRHMELAHIRGVFVLDDSESLIKERLIEVAKDNPPIARAIAEVYRNWDFLKAYAIPRVIEACGIIKEAFRDSENLFDTKSQTGFAKELANNALIQECLAKFKNDLEPLPDQPSWYRAVEHCGNASINQDFVFLHFHDYLNLGRNGSELAGSLLAELANQDFRKWDIESCLLHSDKVMVWLVANNDKRSRFELEKGIKQYFHLSRRDSPPPLRTFLLLPDAQENNAVTNFVNNIEKLWTLKDRCGVQVEITDRLTTRVNRAQINGKKLFIHKNYTGILKDRMMIAFERAESRKIDQFLLEDVLPQSIIDLGERCGLGDFESAAIEHAVINAAYQSNKPEEVGEDAEKNNQKFLSNIGTNPASCFLYYSETRHRSPGKIKSKGSPKRAPSGSFS